ncbi:hypothetical protein KZ820_09025 [Sphingomonas sp. RRHST34]|uniref:Major intrinsic protein n=1 Tax=Sphingomonas citri TaxID=2862499 RepID=A0ABS7BMR9_9SPHN|nr:hypothetical protein [Sphingomonas citri]MBW6530876.1 hypothetical protein [Sphingomonas citri]
MLAAATGVPGSFGLVSVSLTVLTMAFAVGFISGGYSNPAVGVGPVRQLWLFRAAPLLGASVAGLLGRWLFARGRSISRPVRSATCRSSGSSTPTARPRRAEPLER